MKQPPYPFKIAFLLSGTGTTLENLLLHISQGKVCGNVSLVISSREAVYGIELAKNWSIPVTVIPYKRYKNNITDYSNMINSVIDSYHIDLIVLGGFMSQYLIPEKYTHSVINIHPSLIPSFCGKGYYGEYVHQAVFDAGVKVTGCSVHFVDDKYDTGPIIAQKTIPIENEETVENIKSNVKALERELYPKIIQAIIEKRVSVANQKVKVTYSQH